MLGILPSLLLCTLSSTNALTCRNEEGAEIRLREGALRYDAPVIARMVSVRPNGICYVAGADAPVHGARREAGTLKCFDGGGEARPFLDARGEATAVAAAGTRVEANATHACVIVDERLRCWELGGRELAFTETGKETRLVGVSDFAMDDRIVCAAGKAEPVRCFPLAVGRVAPTSAPSSASTPSTAASSASTPTSTQTAAPRATTPGSASTPGPSWAPQGDAPARERIVLRNDAGRELEPGETVGSSIAVDADLACHAKPRASLRCHDLATGRERPFRGKAGFPEDVDASRGLAFGPRTLCALDASGALDCRDRATGARVEFKNPLGFREEPPALADVASEGLVTCGRVASGASKGAAWCYVDGQRVIFRDVSGRPVDRLALSATQLRSGLLCGVDGSTLRCFDLARRTGAEVSFIGEFGFPEPFSVATSYHVGKDTVCGVDRKGVLRCAHSSGEAKPLRSASGGKVRLDGVVGVRLVP